MEVNMKGQELTDAQMIETLQNQIQLYKEQFEKVVKENVAMRQQLEFMVKDLTYKTIEIGFKALSHPQYFKPEILQYIADQIAVALTNTFSTDESEVTTNNE